MVTEVNEEGVREARRSSHFPSAYVSSFKVIERLCGAWLSAGLKPRHPCRGA